LSRSTERDTYTNLLRSLRHGKRQHCVNAESCQQQTDSGESAEQRGVQARLRNTRIDQIVQCRNICDRLVLVYCPYLLTYLVGHIERVPRSAHRQRIGPEEIGLFKGEICFWPHRDIHATLAHVGNYTNHGPPR